MPVDPALAGEAYCYVTTTGRVSGRPHTVEIWFGLRGDTIYILSGERTDWVRNARRQPRVSVRIGGATFDGAARAVEPGVEELAARRMLRDKYAKDNDDLDDWSLTAYPVAIDLAPG